MKSTTMIVIFILGLHIMQAQEEEYYASLPPSISAGLLEPLPVMQNDSLPAMMKPRLLPENISFMERNLWGEDGFFRTTGLASPLTPQSRKAELSLRRTMLVAHQLGGFVTLGSMITACYFGQKIIDGNILYLPNHKIFVTASIISYSATALLAILSPPPLIRRSEASTITIHKTLAWVHFTGMILTPIIGSMISRRSPESQTARFHQIAAYTTTAAMAASLIVVTF